MAANIPEGRVVSRMIFSPDDTLLAFGDTEGYIEIHRIADGTVRGLGKLPEQLTMNGTNQRGISTMAISPDNKILAFVSNKCLSQVYLSAINEPGTTIWPDPNSGYVPFGYFSYGSVLDIKFIAEGRMLLILDDRGMANVWGIK
jgi:hypothetical protein